MSEPFDAATVPVSPAATVMLVRDARRDDGPAAGRQDGNDGVVEVFMLRRTGKATFGAGMYVFPGGRVDDVDHADGIAPYCRGLDDVDASRQLGIDHGGLAFWVASVRECFEEAGVLLAQRRDGGALHVDDGDRHAVHDGSLSMIELCRRHDLVLDLSTTHYVDHWVTPIGERRRFDTRFFLTEAPEGQDGLHDDKETTDSIWVRPQQALEMQAAGELLMMPPTIANLRALAAHRSAHEAVLAAAAKTAVPCILPRLRRDEHGKFNGIALPGDADYADLI